MDIERTGTYMPPGLERTLTQTTRSEEQEEHRNREHWSTIHDQKQNINTARQNSGRTKHRTQRLRKNKNKVNKIIGRTKTHNKGRTEYI